MEAKLQEALAARSVPGQVTDLDRGTLSDEDRETYLRSEVASAEDQTEAELMIGTCDKAILWMIANGF